MIDPLPGDIFRQGQVLNNTYEIEGVLGRGGTGEVYRAKNQVSGRIVAIKALNAQFSGNADYIELMKREEQMRDVTSDAVVRYTECSRSEQGQVFLVMDFVDGPSMADEMVRGRIPAKALLIIAHRVAEGLVAAHKKQIVHRDLSPDNIVLRGGYPERATIIDFGIAKDTAAGARTIVGNDFAGKYEYAAPEQLEGRAEPRSDLYALGALLLAGFRGQVPFAGATPGEMIRRKQEPLDVTGVEEPLKSLILWLTHPKLSERAPSAEVVVEKLDQVLKPDTNARPQIGRRPVTINADVVTPPPTKRWLLPLLLVVLLAGGAWVYGLMDDLIPRSLPVANPYLLTASGAQGDQPATLSGNAPDPASRDAILAAFAKAAAASVPPDKVVLATGAPVEDWTAAATGVLAAIKGLEDWTISLSANKATITGLAPNAEATTTIKARLSDWASLNGFDLTTKIVTGPRLLPRVEVETALAKLADCGGVALEPIDGDAYPLAATIKVTGAISSTSTKDRMLTALRAMAGDRRIELDLDVLNQDVCRVRGVLPVVPETSLSIWFGDGVTGTQNLSGVFHTNDNPIVDILAPANLPEARIYVVVVDNTGKVYNIVPNAFSNETSVAALGSIVDGVRRLRVLHPLSEAIPGSMKSAIRVEKTDYGKSEVIAILSSRPLFDSVRPKDEVIESFVAALAAAQKRDPGNIIGLASRILDARP